MILLKDHIKNPKGFSLPKEFLREKECLWQKTLKGLLAGLKKLIFMFNKKLLLLRPQFHKIIL